MTNLHFSCLAPVESHVYHDCYAPAGKIAIIKPIPKPAPSTIYPNYR